MNEMRRWSYGGSYGSLVEMILRVGLEGWPLDEERVKGVPGRTPDPARTKV